MNLAAVFLGDYEPGRELEDVISSALLAKILELRLGTTVIPLLNKSDLWEGESIDKVWEGILKDELEGITGKGVLSEVLLEISRAISSFRSSILGLRLYHLERVLGFKRYLIYSMRYGAHAET